MAETILRQGDYPFVPDELRLFHAEDFRDVYAVTNTSTISPASCPNHRLPSSNDRAPLSS